jgi:Mrp family chromosome partitioning ATPase/uncharacterized protein involved in exopolysaccharide biosynthesis
MRSALAAPEPLAPLVLIGRALRRHGWLLLLTLAGCGAAAAVAARALQPVYQAAAAVELTVPAPVMQFPGDTANVPDMGTEPGTVAEELANPHLVAAAAVALGPVLAQQMWRQRRGPAPLPPAELTLAALRQLQIVPVAQSRVIQLQFQAPRPQVAVAFLATLLSDYQTQTQAHARAAGLERVAALSQRVDGARAQVLAAQSDLNPYSTQGPAPPAAMALAEQRRQQLEQAETAAEIAALRQADQLAAAPDAAASADLPQDLEVKRAELESELRRLTTIYQPQAAPVEQAQQALAGLNASAASWQSANQLAARQALAAQRQQVRDLTAALAAQGRSQAAIAATAAAYDLAQRRLQADQDTYSNLLDQLQRAAAEAGTAPATLRVIAPPLAAPVPLRPNSRELAASALVLGTLLGALAIWGVEHLRDGVWIPEVTEMGVPLLAGLPPLVADVGGDAAYRPAAVATLAAVLTRAQTDAGCSVVLLTSAEARSGKTTVALALARTLARANAPVLLVDGHAARPGLHPAAGEACAPGVRELLAGSATVDQALRRWPAGSAVWYLPAGVSDAQGLVDLASGAAADLLAAARQRYTWVLIDGGALLEDAAARLWASHADCCLIVAEMGAGSRRRLRRAFELLACASAASAGLVLTRVPGTLPVATEWLAAPGAGAAEAAAVRRWA